MKMRAGRFHLCLGETVGRRIRIGIKQRRGNLIVAGPESQAAHLLRIGLTCDCVGQMGNTARMRRGGPARKTRYRKIKTAPEKMHGTAFAAETRAKFFENAICLQKNAPKTVGKL